MFKEDSLSNVQKINDSFGIFYTTEGKCYVFDLSTLELIDELIIDCKTGDLEKSWTLNALFQTRDEMIFQYLNYKNGKESIEWISVDKLYLDKQRGTPKIAKNSFSKVCASASSRAVAALSFQFSTNCCARILISFNDNAMLPLPDSIPRLT